jgi:sulfur-carrier protein adenylyltransferase/sulfurtransferase
MVPQVSPRELKSRLDAGEHLVILDVREPWEIAVASLPGTLHIPLRDLARRVDELDAGQHVIVMCRSGGRSQQAAQFLATRGFAHVSNLDGGILAWSRDVDPGVAIY